MLKVLLVDDERNALSGLSGLLKQYCPGTEVVGQAATALEGIKLITQLGPDLLFLDVEMPGGNGFDLLSSLPPGKQPEIIFTTAHANYAIPALRERAIDYLLKPIDVDELIAAVNKARLFLQKGKTRSVAAQRLGVNTPQGLVFFPLADVIHIEAEGRYSRIHVANGGNYLATRNIGEYDDELCASGFFRVHKSHLVNCSHVSLISPTDGGFLELSNGCSIEISRRKKSEFLSRMKG